MAIVLPALIAFALAACVTAVELVTTEWPRTSVFVRNSWPFRAYVVVYGVIAAGFTVGADALIASNALKIEGIGADNPWVRAVVLGISVKALLHINLYTLPGPRKFPIGTETVVQLFEPHLLWEMKQKHYNDMRRFLLPYEQKHTGLAQTKTLAINNIPPFVKGLERTALTSDIKSKKLVWQVLYLYLEKFGIDAFESVF